MEKKPQAATKGIRRQMPTGQGLKRKEEKGKKKKEVFNKKDE